MDRVLTETKVKDRLTEHDLRAKCASDAESLEHAQPLLAHADSSTTRRIYRRKPERVKPLKGATTAISGGERGPDIGQPRDDRTAPKK